MIATGSRSSFIVRSSFIQVSSRRGTDPSHRILSHFHSANQSISIAMAASIPTNSTMSTASSSSTSNNSSPSSIKQQLQSIHRKSTLPTPEQTLSRLLVPKFASRAYHLPGNNLRQDWIQYMLNNHPVLGICCSHRLHPLKTTQRVIILLGSFACGIAITNILYLWFLTSGRDDEEEVFAMNFSVNNDDSKTYSVSRGLLTLLTVRHHTSFIYLSSLFNASTHNSIVGWQCFPCHL